MGRNKPISKRISSNDLLGRARSPLFGRGYGRDVRNRMKLSHWINIADIGMTLCIMRKDGAEVWKKTGHEEWTMVEKKKGSGIQGKGSRRVTFYDDPDFVDFARLKVLKDQAFSFWKFRHDHIH